MKNVKETKKYKINEIKKQSESDKLLLEEYNNFIKESVSIIGFYAVADISALLMVFRAFKNNNIFAGSNNFNCIF